MPVIGWVFLLAAVTLIVGGLVILRNSAHSGRIPKDKMDKIRKRKAEVEAQEKADDQW